VFSIRSTGGREQACARFGALESPQPDSKVQLEVHVDARYIGNGVPVGLPTQVSTSTPSITSLVQFATGSAEVLGAAVMATTTSLAATKSRRDRISR
jgi:hypothetical protein